MSINSPCICKWSIIACGAESDSVFVHSDDIDSCLNAVMVHDEDFLRLSICIHIKNNITAKTTCDELSRMIDCFLQIAHLLLLSLDDFLLKKLID